MKRIAIAGLLAASAAWGGFAAAAVKPANDVSIKMKLGDTATVGPLANITVKNLGTSTQNGVIVKIFAESEMGLELWSGTVDVLPSKSAVLSQRVWLDVDTTALVATAALAGASDEDPTDNTARGGLGLKGKPALAIVGRAIHLAHCASCHGTDASGGTGPTLVGKSSKTILAEITAGGDHDFPWISKTDAKVLGFFYKDPSGTILPPSLPSAPPGGWPTYEGSVKALLDDRCVNCHGPKQVSAGINLGSYNGASSNAKRSLASVKSGRMPQGGKRFSATEIALIENWILGGRRQ